MFKALVSELGRISKKPAVGLDGTEKPGAKGKSLLDLSVHFDDFASEILSQMR